MKRFAMCLCVLAVVVIAGHARAAPFLGLGRILGGPDPAEISASWAADISANGSTVVGGATTARGDEAFRFSAETRMVSLGRMPTGRPESWATGVSADGSVIVGTYQVDGAGNTDAFRWTEEQGVSVLHGWPNGIRTASAHGVSSDGSIVVGNLGDATGWEAFRWTHSSGLERLGDLAGGGYTESSANGISADGAMIAGYGNDGHNDQAVAWVRGNPPFAMGSDPSRASYAVRISDDGATAAGHVWVDADRNACYWVEMDGVWQMRMIDDLPGGGVDARAYDASDASRGPLLLVGEGTTASGPEAFIWEPGRGTQNLQEVLMTQYGFGDGQMAHWTLTSATAITPNGRGIAGMGINPHGE